MGGFSARGRGVPPPGYRGGGGRGGYRGGAPRGGGGGRGRPMEDGMDYPNKRPRVM